MITLNSKTLMVKRRVKVTKARLFSGLRDGDTIQIKMDVKDPGYGRARYATELSVSSSTGETGIFTLTNLSSYLKCFDWEEQDVECSACAERDGQDPSY